MCHLSKIIFAGTILKGFWDLASADKEIENEYSKLEISHGYLKEVDYDTKDRIHALIAAIGLDSHRFKIVINPDPHESCCSIFGSLDHSGNIWIKLSAEFYHAIKDHPLQRKHKAAIIHELGHAIYSDCYTRMKWINKCLACLQILTYPITLLALNCFFKSPLIHSFIGLTSVYATKTVFQTYHNHKRELRADEFAAKKTSSDAILEMLDELKEKQLKYISFLQDAKPEGLALRLLIKIYQLRQTKEGDCYSLKYPTISRRRENIRHMQNVR